MTQSAHPLAARLGGGSGAGVLLIKYDTAGVRRWVRRFDGSRHNYDYVTEVVANGSSVYGAGAVTTLKGQQDMLRRYRPLGASVWMRVCGRGGLESEDSWNDVVLTPDGDAVVTGTTWMGTGYDWATAIYRPSGALAWSRRVSTRGYDGGTAVAVDPAGTEWDGPGWQPIRRPSLHPSCRPRPTPCRL